MARTKIETAGKDEQAEYGDGTVAIAAAFRERKTERRAKDDSEEAAPADSKTDSVREREEGLADKRMPDSTDWFGDDRVWDVAEGDESDERPSEDGLDNPAAK